MSRKQDRQWWHERVAVTPRQNVDSRRRRGGKWHAESAVVGKNTRRSANVEYVRGTDRW